MHLNRTGLSAQYTLVIRSYALCAYVMTDKPAEWPHLVLQIHDEFFTSAPNDSSAFNAIAVEVSGLWRPFTSGIRLVAAEASFLLYESSAIQRRTRAKSDDLRDMSIVLRGICSQHRCSCKVLSLVSMLLKPLCRIMLTHD